MPIPVSCPNCSARINAPDSAAGKRAKCPKCGGVIPIPAAEPEVEVVDDDFEVVDDEPAPKKKPRPRDEDEDDEPPRRKASRRSADANDGERPRKKKAPRRDDDDDDRPRRSKGKKAAKSSSLPLIIGGGVLLLVIGIGIFVWQLTKASGDGNAPGKTAGGNATPVKPALPAGWVTFDEPGGRFSAAMPAQPESVDVSALMDPTAAEMKMWQCQPASGKVFKVLLQVDKQPPPAGEPPTSVLNRICDNFTRNLGGAFGRETNRGPGTLGGFKAAEMIFANGSVKTIIRLTVANQKLFVAMVQLEAFDPTNDADTQSFFTNFRPK